jgi:hypothetical protein
MTYILHQYDYQYGWDVVSESSNIEDFGEHDKWAFDHISKNGNEYIKMGDTMWSIDWNTNNKGKK